MSSLIQVFYQNFAVTNWEKKNEEKDSITLDDIMTEFLKLCVDNGIIEIENGVTIDTTYTDANTFKCTVERVMKRLARKLIETVEEENGELPEGVNQEIPEYKEIEDHKVAKATMKSFLEETISTVEESIDLECNPKTKSVVENAKEILADPKFLEQKGVRSIDDQDARVGYKSKTSNFYGYKTEYMMTTKERIITSVHTGSGAYVDGTKFEKLLEQTQRAGITIKDVYGDKAYFRKPILTDKI